MENTLVALAIVGILWAVYSRWARVNAQALKDFNKAVENNCEAILDTQTISKKYPKDVFEKAVKYAKK